MTARSDVLWSYLFNEKTKEFSNTELRQAFASATDKNLLVAPDYIEAKTDRIMLSSVSPYFEYTPHPIAYDEKKAAEYYKKALEQS